MDRRQFLVGAGAGVAAALIGAEGLRAAPDTAATLPVAVDTGRPNGPLPHAWEKVAGSDRGNVVLRSQYQDDLTLVRDQIGIEEIRFHGILNDENGVCTSARPPGWEFMHPGEPGPPADAVRYSFQYVDRIYDTLRDHGVRPFVELSFMPKVLASGASTVFYYQGNVTPPKKMEDWAALVGAFAAHCRQRYGAREVRQWKWEVWNEPNMHPYFWAGTQQDYFELYRHAATALKAVDRELRVGGPATAMTAWVPDFLAYCTANAVPVDFVSTHIYGNDPQDVVFGPGAPRYPVTEVVSRAVAKVHDQIRASKRPDLPLHITEWSSPNPAFIAEVAKGCLGLAETMSYWTFSAEFEEMGPWQDFITRIFGLVGHGGVPTEAFNAFVLLRRLGDTRLAAGDGPVLASRRPDGTVSVLLWNLTPVDGAPNPRMPQFGWIATPRPGKPLTVRLALRGLGGRRTALLSRVDAQHGSPDPAYAALGKPEYPTPDQVSQLRKAATLGAPERLALRGSEPEQVEVVLPPDGIALLEIPARA